ncbi:MAG: selenide, water dikinase SelD [Polyangiaceae bacterium]|nr:selenide, water dikinase SelD [Polyangiaceae bacterium]
MVQALKHLPQSPLHPWVDDSPGPLDDAALVRPDPASANGLVMTIDVVTPMVDDPEAFGAIAAANALSDVYAMGGEPKVALSFIGFPSDVLPLEVLGAIVRGMGVQCERAGCAIVGGHTIVDPEPKAGLAVTGSVDRGRVWSHRSGRAGQVLVLTKAIGTGVVVQALKKNEAPADVVAAAVASMRDLNDRACRAGIAAGVTSGTDVTGFGLLGHLKNLCEASNVQAHLRASDVPMLPGVVDLAKRGFLPGGTKRNLRYVEPAIRFDAEVDETTRLLLADAQTSGGLLLCTPAESVAMLCKQLADEGCVAAVIGTLAPSAGDGVAIAVSG